MGRTYSQIAIVMTLASLLLATPPSVLGGSSIRMQIHDPESDELLYTAVRTLDQQENNSVQVTTYYSLDGSKIQVDSVLYDPATLTLTYCRSVDLRSGKVEQMNLVDGAVEILFFEKRGAQPEKVMVPWTETTTFRDALVPLISRNWQLLQDGQELEMELLLPHHLEAMGMRLKKGEGIILNGRPATVISLGSRIWLFRKIIGPMSYIITDDDAHQLLIFQGLYSRFTDDNGKMRRLKVVYNYEAK